MKTDREIQRFVADVESPEEYFYLIDLLHRKFNLWGVTMGGEDVQIAFRNTIGRDITEPEFDLLLDRCDAMYESELDKVAMELLERFCRNTMRSAE